MTDAEKTAASLARQRRQRTIADAPTGELSERWQALALDPVFSYLRGPETGLVSLRGRMGGGGAPFPFGDATATRVSVRLEDGTAGHSMVLGRDSRRATIAAVVDALCASAGLAGRIDEELIAPLEAGIAARDARRARQTAATKVDFFTMVRGED